MVAGSSTKLVFHKKKKIFDTRSNGEIIDTDFFNEKMEL
jgi:hypothetical protein